MPLEVPESFWNGGAKLSWPTDQKQILFAAFPTLHIGFAADQDPNSEFALAVQPQVSKLIYNVYNTEVMLIVCASVCV